MRRRQLLASVALLVAPALMASCGGGSATPTTAVPLPKVKAAPITVASPEQDSSINGPISVTGTAEVKGSQLVVELRDEAQAVLASAQLGTPKSGIRGVYNVALSYGGGHRGPAVVAVYAISPYDGSHVHEVNVPVVLGY